MGVKAEEQLDQLVVRRLDRLVNARRFVFSWLLLLALLGGGVVYQLSALGSQYKVFKATSGGTYNEGIIGSFTNSNPLYATGPVDGAVSRLLFAGLLKHDQSNKLVGDLAESYKVDAKGSTYTVVLRKDLRWHDGKPLTSEDVVYTYRTIQNPDAKSPLMSSWQGVQINATDSRTIQFVLPNSLSAFPFSLTNGIVPKHLLAKLPVSQLRSAQFNTDKPVGSGPFVWSAIEVTGQTSDDRQERIALLANKDYYDGSPKLDRFEIKTFRNEDAMRDSFARKELTAMSGLDMVPDLLQASPKLQEHNTPLTSQAMVFFKNSHEVLKDPKIRQALVYSTDQNDLLRNMPYPVLASRQPLLPFHVGYNSSLNQLAFDAAAANKLLDEAGWVKSGNGIRAKAEQPLTFRLFAQNSGEYAYVSQKLQKDWRRVGIDVQVLLQDDIDLRSTVANHNYDALLYAISLGNDADVLPYWYSTQADATAANRVNFSEYKSTAADKALEAGRTRSDAQIRAIKYKPFLEAWRTDAPAIALYQPRYLYLTEGEVDGLNLTMMNSSNDRYANVYNWMIRQEAVN